jgi:hypothetical protein
MYTKPKAKTNNKKNEKTSLNFNPNVHVVFYDDIQFTGSIGELAFNEKIWDDLEGRNAKDQSVLWKLEAQELQKQQQIEAKKKKENDRKKLLKVALESQHTKQKRKEKKRRAAERRKLEIARFPPKRPYRTTKEAKYRRTLKRAQHSKRRSDTRKLLHGIVEDVFQKVQKPDIKKHQSRDKLVIDLELVAQVQEAQRAEAKKRKQYRKTRVIRRYQHKPFIPLQPSVSYHPKRLPTISNTIKIHPCL